MYRLLSSMVLSHALVGCESPCREGYARTHDGMCNEIIGTDLDETAAPMPETDTGMVDDTDEPQPEDIDRGTITIQPTLFPGWLHHAYVIEAFAEDENFAEAALCQILLTEPVTVSGQLMSWTPGYQSSCAVDTPTADVHSFAAGPVTLMSYIYAGEGASPSACGEVVVMVDGDVSIEAPAVGDCE